MNQYGTEQKNRNKAVTNKLNLPRRAAIISAAKRCFERSGLHGASVSAIALEANLSVGQLYRVFQSKEEIIEEIVNNITSDKIEYMISHNLLRETDDVFSKEFSEVNEKLRKDNFLLMEINAEASRNNKILAIILTADKRLKEQGSIQLQRMYPDLNNDQVGMMLEFMAIVFDGISYRQNIYDAYEEKSRLRALYKEVFRYIVK